jgi:predicted acyl esterase
VFDPDGHEVDFQGALDPHTFIGNGWLRASHRKLDPELTRDYRPYHTHDEYQPLLRGKVYELDVEIWPTCLVVPAGYRIALTLLGKDFERPLGGGSLGTVLNPMRSSGPFLHNTPQDRPMEIFDNEHTIYGGGNRGSYLLLPVIPK